MRGSIEAVLFDLDGTLADSVPLMRAIYEEYLRRHGAAGSEVEFAELSGRTLPEIVRVLKARLRLDDDEATLLAQYRALIDESYAYAKPMCGAQDVLSTLSRKGFRLGLVTSASEALARGFLRRNGLDGLFQDVVCGDDATPGKPNPALYLRALESSRIDPRHVVAVEDSENGIRSAEAAGIGLTIRAGNGAMLRDLMRAFLE